jgi:hypothetical protein
LRAVYSLQCWRVRSWHTPSEPGSALRALRLDKLILRPAGTGIRGPLRRTGTGMAPDGRISLLLNPLVSLGDSSQWNFRGFVVGGSSGASSTCTKSPAHLLRPTAPGGCVTALRRGDHLSSTDPGTTPLASPAVVIAWEGPLHPASKNGEASEEAGSHGRRDVEAESPSPARSHHRPSCGDGTREPEGDRGASRRAARERRLPPTAMPGLAVQVGAVAIISPGPSAPLSPSGGCGWEKLHREGRSPAPLPPGPPAPPSPRCAH